MNAAKPDRVGILFFTTGLRLALIARHGKLKKDLAL